MFHVKPVEVSDKKQGKFHVEHNKILNTTFKEYVKKVETKIKNPMQVSRGTLQK